MPSILETTAVPLSSFLAQAGPDDLVVTASKRLAIEIRGRLAGPRRSGAFLLPEVVPYDAWLREAWSRLRYRVSFASKSAIAEATLLSPGHEALLWEQVLREAGAADRLLFLDETIEACIRAAALAEQYELPLEHPAWERDDESSTFLAWYRRVRALCREQKWVLPARLPAILREQPEAWRDLCGKRLLLAGFEEISPVQESLFASLAAQRIAIFVLETRLPQSFATADSIKIQSAANAEEELRAAADWAASRLQANPEARLAVVAPDLASRRSEAEIAFLDALHSGWQTAAAMPSQRRFHLSMGEPLSANPVAAAGLRLLEWLNGADSASAAPLLADARALLRCPYFARAAAERTPRARLESLLLSQRTDRVSLRLLRELALPAERLSGESLAAWREAIQWLEQFDARGEEPPSLWAARLRALWTQVLWLGQPSLNSDEFQARRRTLEELGALAELDLVRSRMSFREFAHWLRRQFRTATFQPESLPAPVLVAGFFEVTGLSFDAAWVCGLNDTVLPPLPRPDPFLPRSLQREYNLPGSSAAREIAFASREFERLCQLAPLVVMSYPERQEEEQLEPSPFLQALTLQPGIAVSRVSPSATPLALPPAPLEEIPDWQADPLPEADLSVRRGVQVLADQSDCPFRAFARTRLDCDPQEAESELMNRLDQGAFVHRALQEFWQRTGSLDALLALSPIDREARIAECTAIALRDFEVPAGNALARAQRDAEAIRIAERMHRWLQFEEQRHPFRVATTEKDRKAQFGGLTLGIRPDRIDQLPDGSVVLVDYKTGSVDASQWDGERPAQPQLLAYLAAEQRAVSALAFASLKTSDTGWKARGRNLARDFFSKGRPSGDDPDWPAFVADSRDTVERLAQQFRNGFAPVDPAPDRNPCEFCEQKPLCRIAEWRSVDNAANEEGDPA